MSLLSDPKLRQLFEEEAEMCLAEVERRLPDADEPEAAKILRRSAHTLKGSAGMMGLASLRDIAEALEAVLAALGPGGRELTPGLRDAILAAVADLRHLVSNLLHGLDPGRAAQDIEQGLRALLAPAGPAAARAAPADDLLRLVARAQLATLGLLADHLGLDPAAIPAHAGLAAALGAPPAAAAPQPRAAVLVVDDSPMVRALHRSALEDAGFDVDVAEHGREALAVLAGRRLDAVVTDLEMPEMDGWELTEAIRARPDGAGLGILVVSGREDDAARRRAFAVGADDYRVKDAADVEGLVASVRRVAGQPA